MRGPTPFRNWSGVEQQVSSRVTAHSRTDGHCTGTDRRPAPVPDVDLVGCSAGSANGSSRRTPFGWSRRARVVSRRAPAGAPSAPARRQTSPPAARTARVPSLRVQDAGDRHRHAPAEQAPEVEHAAARLALRRSRRGRPSALPALAVADDGDLRAGDAVRQQRLRAVDEPRIDLALGDGVRRGARSAGELAACCR